MVKMFTGIKTFDGVIFYKIYIFFIFQPNPCQHPPSVSMVDLSSHFPVKRKRHEYIIIETVLMIAATFLFSVGNSYEPVGCFNDKGVAPRPLPEFLGSFRKEINWKHVELTVDKCAKLAQKKG